jgi:peptidoglycan/xylan/chitin deacetylase (PgdA/CDA1 family)
MSEPRKALILMYHRVTDITSDPWSLCVSKQHFAEHLEVLSSLTQPVPLPELLSTLVAGTQRGVAVTFDDGYADNLWCAKPLLAKYRVPATVFVTTGYLGSQREFWWDELERVLLSPGTLPALLELNLGGRTRRWNLRTAAFYADTDWQRDRAWKAPNDPPTARHALYVSIWSALKALPERDQQNVLDELRGWATASPGARATHRVLSPQELVVLKDGDFVEIGAHSVTHPILVELPLQEQQEELRRSKATLEEILGSPVTSFAYPYGDCDTNLISCVREAGFARACTTVAEMVTDGADPFQLPRVEVLDWSGQEFECRLREWFS